MEEMNKWDENDEMDQTVLHEMDLRVTNRCSARPLQSRNHMPMSVRY